MVAEPAGTGAPGARELPWWPLVAMLCDAAIVAAVLVLPLLPVDQRTVLWTWEWTRNDGIAPYNGDPIYLLV